MNWNHPLLMTWVFQRQHWLGIAYAVWALPVLLAIAIIAPPWTATDEPFHMARAVSIAHGHVIGERWEAQPGAPPGSGAM